MAIRPFLFRLPRSLIFPPIIRTPAATILPADTAKLPDPDEDDWFPEEEDEIPATNEDAYLQAEEINLEDEFIGFEASETSEVYPEGIAVEAIARTADLLKQDPVPEGARAEVIHNAGLLEGTVLWESFLASKEGVKDNLEAITQEVRQERGEALASYVPDISHLKVPAYQGNSFEHVDVDELINKVG
jgi:hypothetical protein